MNRNFHKSVKGTVPNESRPTEAWLYAQALLGNPLPNPREREAKRQAERKELEWLAEISTRHEEPLRDLLRQEAEARHERELLEWLAQISTRHEDELRNLQREEALDREADELAQRSACMRRKPNGIRPSIHV